MKKKIKIEIGVEEIAVLKNLAMSFLKQNISSIDKNTKYLGSKAVMLIDRQLHDQKLCDSEKGKCAFDFDQRLFKEAFKSEIEAEGTDEFDDIPDLTPNEVKKYIKKGQADLRQEIKGALKEISDIFDGKGEGDIQGLLLDKSSGKITEIKDFFNSVKGDDDEGIDELIDKVKKL